MKKIMRQIRLHKPLTISCLALFAYLIIGGLIRKMVRINGYEFRSWLSTTAFLLFLFFALCTLVQIIGALLKLTFKMQQHRLLQSIPIVILVCIILISLYAIPWITPAYYQFEKEYCVEKNGIEMVAYVSQDADVTVYYYESVNFAFRKKDLALLEEYGTISLNPLLEEVSPEPKNSIVYSSQID